MIGGLGWTELIIILAIVLVIFGPKKLPEIGSGIGKAISNFKNATNEPDTIEVAHIKEKGEEEAKEKAES